MDDKDFSNERLVAAHADADALIAAIPDLECQLAALQERLALARAVRQIDSLHRGVAVSVDPMGDDEVLVCALGADVWADGRRALVFRDARSGEGWSARLHYRTNFKESRPRDPGAFDFPTRAAALESAKDWAALAVVPGG